MPLERKASDGSGSTLFLRKKVFLAQFLIPGVVTVLISFTNLPDLTTMAKRNGGTFPAARAHEIIEGAGKGHGTREMPVWGDEYTLQATETLPELPYNQAMYVRTRIMALLEYLNQIQAK